MRLLVTRPEPDALKLRAALEERGHEATVEPLLTVSFDDTDPIDLEGVQAVIATSRNGLKALRSHPQLAEARKLPLFAVGRATATEARALGFETVITGAGTAAQLVAHIVSVADPAAGLILQLAGDTLAGDLKGELELQGFRVVQPVVYRMQPAKALSEDTVEQLAMGEIDGRHLDVAQNCVNLCRAHAQAGARLRCSRARAFLSVGGNIAAARALGRGPQRGCRDAQPGRNACPDRWGRGKLARLDRAVALQVVCWQKLRSPEAAYVAGLPFPGEPRSSPWPTTKRKPAKVCPAPASRRR